MAEEAEEAEEGSQDELGSEVEVADIEALARAQLQEGESILEKGRKEKNGVCNKPGLLAKLAEIEYKVPEGAKRVPWVDTLAIDGQQELPSGIKAKDGVKLEGAFMRMASEAVREAYRRLKVMRIPCSRPADFYAEMMRTDQMMYKVRARSAEEQRRIKIVEDRKKSQAAKKFAKRARSKKLEVRAQEKRKTLEDIKTWQKKNKQDKKNTDDQDLESILNRQQSKQGKGGGKGGGKGEQERFKPKQKSAKRQLADQKFGHGGMKRKLKTNDGVGLDDDFGGKGGKGGKGGEGGGKGSGPRVFVGNLDFRISWQDLKDHMRQAGNVRFCDVLRDQDGRPKGCGIVEYSTEEECETALSVLNDSELGSRPIYVKRAEERSGPGRH